MKKILISLLVLAMPYILWAYPKYEMRAAWIATVENIDWPSVPGLSVEVQQKEMIAMLDSLQLANINAVFFQVRPSTDAIYDSKLEPWSHYLMGKQGQAPEPFYDPLAFVCYQAHLRCMEVHAWINPYRMLNSADTSLLDTTHLFFTHPEWFILYGGKYYFNPGLKPTQERLIEVVSDIVKRYDIDGVHMDDYFYPYPSGGKAFPDAETFKENPRGFTEINAWRRDNVNTVIKTISERIKTIKPWVVFGVSPFGVWRNIHQDSRGSKTRSGMNNYDDLHADVLMWIEQGYIDYVVPQLYWAIGRPNLDYNTLLEWWGDHKGQCNLYIGQAVYKLGRESSYWQTGNEICREIDSNRSNAKVSGSVFFRAKDLVANRQGLRDSLQSKYYFYPALVPPSLTLNAGPSLGPTDLREVNFGSRHYLFWDKVEDYGGYMPSYYVVYAYPGKELGDRSNPVYIYCTTQDTVLDLKDITHSFDGVWTFEVTTINRFRIESTQNHQLTIQLKDDSSLTLISH